MAKPNAVYRDPLTLAEYPTRMIVRRCRTDCDVPMDGSTALVARRSTRRPNPHPAADTEPSAWRSHAAHTIVVDLATAAGRDARRSCGRAPTTGDVDVAELYDGFSILVLLWLEALGFCAPGESGAYVEGGARIGPGGELPLNTHGGQLSAGRMHGFGLVHEACLQMRGTAGDRQVAHAEVALVSNGGLGPLAAALPRAR
jgi:acetyl-CoA acetyltransferase